MKPLCAICDMQRCLVPSLPNSYWRYSVFGHIVKTQHQMNFQRSLCMATGHASVCVQQWCWHSTASRGILLLLFVGVCAFEYDQNVVKTI